MTKQIYTIVFILISTINTYSQNRTTDFKISPPKKAVSNSLYKTIRYVDSRNDTTYMGAVASGLLNTNSGIVFSPPLSVQLSNIIGNLADNTAKNGAMLFQLRHLVFSQKPGGFSNKGYSFLKAELYADKGNQYVHLASIDTMILIKSLGAGTSSLFNATGEVITAFITDHLFNTGSDVAAYTYNDILNIDSLEKLKIPLYNTINYIEGIYENWESFENQKPNWTSQIIAEPENKKISKVEFIDSSNEKQKLVSKQVYAIVFKGQPYISTDYGYYLLEKKDNNFFFTGKAKVYTGTGARILSRHLLGPFSALYELNQSDTFEFKIDHTDGGFIRNKELKDKTENK